MTVYSSTILYCQWYNFSGARKAKQHLGYCCLCLFIPSICLVYHAFFFEHQIYSINDLMCLWYQFYFVFRFIPVDRREENDQPTHKWMVYVRGSKDSPDISHFVQKVWFFLHPSYRPNDLVEVRLVQQLLTYILGSCGD